MYSGLDLCPLYKDVRIRDFDNMKSFLAELIPKKSTCAQICKILKEIWVGEDVVEMKEQIIEESEEGPESEGEEKTLMQAMEKDTKSELQEVLSKKPHSESRSVDFYKASSIWSDFGRRRNKNEVLTDLSSVSDEQTNSVHEEDEEDILQNKLLDIIQNALPDIYHNEETKHDLLWLPRNLLKYVFESDKTCAPEILFFKIIEDLSSISPFGVHKYDGSVGTYKDDNTINEEDMEYEENKEESKEEDDWSLKIEEVTERSESVAINPSGREYVMDLIPFIRLALIANKDLVTIIKKSSFFSHDSIFEALSYKLALKKPMSGRRETPSSSPEASSINTIRFMRSWLRKCITGRTLRWALFSLEWLRVKSLRTNMSLQSVLRLYPSMESTTSR